MYRSRVLGPSTSWKLVVSLKHQLLYSQGKSPQYPMNRRLGRPNCWSGQYEEVRILDPARTQTPRLSSPQSVARLQYVACTILQVTALQYNCPAALISCCMFKSINLSDIFIYLWFQKYKYFYVQSTSFRHALLKIKCNWTNYKVCKRTCLDGSTI
jgi:hypothetical protein